MEYVPLGSSGLTVSRLTVGCEPLGGTDWGDYDVADVHGAIRAALDAGINSFDVADVYSLGLAEERLSEALGESRKDAVVITKFGVRWEGGENGNRARTFSDASPKHLAASLEGSLRRLKIDCIPVYLVHRPDPGTPLEVTLGALDRYREAGKIRCYGLSNFSEELAAPAIGRPGLAVIENEYNLMQRAAEPMLRTAAAGGVGVVTYGTLAHGFLTGAYSAETRFPPNDRRHRMEMFGQASWRRRSALLKEMRVIAGRHGCSPAGVAIRWTLGNPWVTSAIVGAKSARQVEDGARAVEGRLTLEEREFLAAAGQA